MYSGLRGTVKLKPEVAELMQEWMSDDRTSEFSKMYDHNIWTYIAIQTDNDNVLDFSKDGRSDFIPYGQVCYMPDGWYNRNTLSCRTWMFCCSLKNYNGTIDTFIELLPEIATAWDLEELYEEDNLPSIHKSGEF